MTSLQRDSIRVVLVDTYDFCSFCKLPKKYALEMEGCSLPQVLQLSKDEGEGAGGPDILAVAWTGGVSQVYPDAIEVSRAYVDNLAAQSSVSSSHVQGNPDSWVYYTVHFPEVEQAVQLELTPVDVSDWRLVSAQADL